MMHAATALLYFFTVALLSGHEPSKVKLTGIWWGTAIDPEYGSAHQRDHWIIERKSDGTYRVQEFRVDHEKKLYIAFPKKPVSGRWTIQGRSITHRLDTKEYEQTDLIRFDGKIVRWDRKTQIGFDRYDVHFTEQPTKTFEPSLGKGYRQVSEEAFDNRFKPNGEQGDARRPATAADAKSEGTKKPKPESKGLSR